MSVDSSAWSGEGDFTRGLVDVLSRLDSVEFVRVEDAPASRAEAGFCFIGNEIYVKFRTRIRRERTRRFLIPVTRRVEEKAMTLGDLEAALTRDEAIGAPDYTDEGMLQFLRTERIVPPYQSKGYKLIEMVRIYESPASPAGRATAGARNPNAT